MVSSSTKYGFLFSVRIADDSATTDVILFKKVCNVEFPFFCGLIISDHRMLNYF